MLTSSEVLFQSAAYLPFPLRAQGPAQSRLFFNAETLLFFFRRKTTQETVSAMETKNHAS